MCASLATMYLFVSLVVWMVAIPLWFSPLPGGISTMVAVGALACGGFTTIAIGIGAGRNHIPTIRCGVLLCIGAFGLLLIDPVTIAFLVFLIPILIQSRMVLRANRELARSRESVPGGETKDV